MKTCKRLGCNSDYFFNVVIPTIKVLVLCNLSNITSRLYTKLDVWNLLYLELAPNYMTSMFEKSNNTHDTRNSMSVFTIPRVNKFGLNLFKYTGIKLWNNLPLTIKTKTSKNVFKKSVKQYMMSQLIANSRNVFIYY